MTISCRVCGNETIHNGQEARRQMTSGICDACGSQVSVNSDNRAFLESIDAPVLLMQGNPRQVVTANGKALELFGKRLRDVEAHRGGQVFDCVHSFTEAGCGKDPNCEGCKIKDAIVDTFTSGRPSNGVSTALSVRKATGITRYALKVSTEKVGDLALVRMERYEADD